MPDFVNPVAVSLQSADVVLNTLLADWAAGSEFKAVSNVVRDSNGVLLSADIVWPNGVAGAFVTDSVNSVTPAVDAYHATYLGTTTKIVTQPAVTRDANGAVTVQPTITIS